jgi:catalase
MPLPSDEELVKSAGDVVAQLQAIFGKHPGFRPGQIESNSEENN